MFVYLSILKIQEESIMSYSNLINRLNTLHDCDYNDFKCLKVDKQSDFFSDVPRYYYILTKLDINHKCLNFEESKVYLLPLGSEGLLLKQLGEFEATFTRVSTNIDEHICYIMSTDYSVGSNWVLYPIAASLENSDVVDLSTGDMQLSMHLCHNIPVMHISGSTVAKTFNVDTTYKDLCKPVVNLKSNTILDISCDVHLDELFCESGCNALIITGDGSLSVEHDRPDIAIGVSITETMGSGFYQLPTHKVNMLIDIKEIHTSTAISGCGIGTFAVESIKSDWFTDNCVIRNTPVDYNIVLPTLHGTTKYTKNPEYLSDLELQLSETQFNLEVSKNLSFDKAIPSLTSLFQEYFDLLSTGHNEAGVRVQDKILTSVSKALNKLNRHNFAEGVLRICASFAKAVYSKKYYLPGTYHTPIVQAMYLALSRELQLFDEVAYLPLSMRFLLVAGDIVENETVETEDLSNVTSWDEIGLNDKLKEHYNLLDRSYKKQCSRSLYGYPYYVWRHDYNDLVKPNVVKQGTTVSANCMLVPNYQTIDNLPNRRNGFAYPSNGWSVKYCKALKYKVLQLTEVDVDSSDLENDAVLFYSLNLDLIDTLFE